MRQRLELDISPVENVRQTPIPPIRDLWRIAYRHRWKMALVFLAPIVAVAAGILLVKKNYQSESILFLRLGRENSTLDATATLGQGTTIIQPVARENEINSVAEVLQSRGLLEKVVDAFGPAPLLGPTPIGEAAESALPIWAEQSLRWLNSLNPFAIDDRERAVQKLSRKLRVEAVPHANVVELTYRGYTPQTAQAVVAKLVDLYLDEHVRLNRTPRSHEVLSEQAGRLNKGLTGLEGQLHDLMNRRTLVSTDGRQQALDDNLSQSEVALRETTAALAASEAQVKGLTAQLGSLPELEVTSNTTGINDYGTDLMRNQLYTLVLREKELAAKYTDQYSELRDVRAQLRAAREAVAREERSHGQKTTGPGYRYGQIQLDLMRENARLASLRSKSAALNRQIAEIHRQMSAFNDASFRIRTLQREIDLKDDNYRKYSQAAEQARLDETMELQRISNVGVAQPATLELDPVFPRPWFLAVAALVGLCAAAALAYYLEWSDRTLLAAQDVETHTGLPVLGALPVLHEKTMAGAAQP